MKHLTVMIKPASSLCNMRCRYCFYEDVSQSRAIPSYGMMSAETADALIARVAAAVESGGSITFAFQGGEPLLAGMDFFRFFIDQSQKKLSHLRINYSLQTNGVLLDAEWCQFLYQNHFLVGLSLDGYAELHNKNRIDAGGKESYTKVINAKKLLDDFKVEYNILTVLTSEAARRPQRIWKFIKEEKISFVQFVPCLDELHPEKKNPWALTPRRFFEFYNQLFLLWREEVLKGNYISVKLFDDLVNLFVRQQVTACGINGQCNPQFIIEADGGVYPCDFYVLDEYLVGNIHQSAINEIASHPKNTDFVCSRKQLPDACNSCRYRQACGGGCKRMEQAMYVDASGYCGLQHFLDAHLSELCHIGSILLNYR